MNTKTEQAGCLQCGFPTNKHHPSCKWYSPDNWGLPAKQTHTPEPPSWYTTTKPDDAQGLIADERTGANIAVSYDPKHAHLIAAAPDLLAACKAWKYAREEGGISMVDWFNVAWEKTQSAIEKAEAGQ